MKRQLPLVLGFLVGAFAFLEYYLPARGVRDVMAFLLEMGQALAGAAFLLGALNVVQVNLPIVIRRRPDWPYKLLLVGSAGAMLLAGVGWHEIFAGSPGTITTRPAPGAPATLVVRADGAGAGGADVSLDGAPVPLAADGAVQRELAPGPHTISVRATRRGYSSFEAAFDAAPGQTVVVTVRIRMLWGPSGRVFVWLYDNVFDPCNATMFALLAFFIASAAFRAFRARNAEAALLLGAAILVMLGRVPIGRLISELFPAVADWIVDYANSAGRRAILMGSALGVIATSLRVILGIERSHLGSD